jgi:hypothetical protein
MSPMFETVKQGRKSHLWKFIPLAVILFGALVFLALFFAGSGRSEQEELTGIIRRDNPDFQWYSEYVELQGTKIQMGLNFARKRILMISGVIQNGGERTLDVVEVKLTFFNYEEPVKEIRRTPIQPSRYTPPIPPLNSRAFSFYVEDFPKDWKQSHAEIELNGIRFAGEGY